LTVATDFREEWAALDRLKSVALRLLLASEPRWQAYLLPRMTALLDDYGIDRICNDRIPIFPKDHRRRWECSPSGSEKRDGALEDLLASSRKSRTTRDRQDPLSFPSPAGLENRIYDYLCGRVGARRRRFARSREDYRLSGALLDMTGEDRRGRLYLRDLPAVPAFLGGRPFTEEQAAIQG
jgi:hypothetical protein